MDQPQDNTQKTLLDFTREHFAETGSEVCMIILTSNETTGRIKAGITNDIDGVTFAMLVQQQYSERLSDWQNNKTPGDKEFSMLVWREDFELQIGKSYEQLSALSKGLVEHADLASHSVAPKPEQQ